MLEPADRAASTSALAVIDLEPGRRTEVATGRWAVGAVQAAAGGAELRAGASVTPPLCRGGGPARRSRVRTTAGRVRLRHVWAVRLDAQLD